MKTLLIWDWFGEQDIGLYLIEDAPDWLTDCHQKFANGAYYSPDVDDALSRVSDALCENPDHYSTPEDELAGAWVSCKIDTDEPALLKLDGPVRIIVSGFMP